MFTMEDSTHSARAEDKCGFPQSQENVFTTMLHANGFLV